MLQSINPYTEKLNWEFNLLDSKWIDEVIEMANNSYLTWRDVSDKEKKELFLKLALEIEKDIDECAKLQTIEMWMLYDFSKKWLLWTINLIRWYADNFESIIWEKDYKTSDWIEWKEIYDPIWVIFWIAPWNFPFNQLLRAAVPNILAWNTQIYKHSSNVPMCALKIQELFDNAWFPKWVFNNVFVSSSLSEHIISNKLIKWINLTGSERAGVAVWALAWKYLKPSILELWGNDAFVLCNTDDVKWFAEKAADIKMRNWWQTCNGSKRFIILEKHYDEFCKEFTRAMSELKIWDPSDINTDVQPMASLKAIDEMEEQIIRATNSWAKLLTWWKRAEMDWYFMTPTVLSDVTPETSSYNEEIFWPVASIMKSQSLEHSIELANWTDFWLSACVFWDDRNEVIEIAKKMEWWMVFVNQWAASKPSLPFWWIKKSGFWKENWPEWLRAFTNKKILVF